MTLGSPTWCSPRGVVIQIVLLGGLEFVDS
jgi:hypothetical protein